jgi:hypothetical protein
MAVRDRLAEDLEERYDKLLEVIEDAMKATKQHRAWCPECKKSVTVEVTDTRAALLAAEFITNQGFGRPGQAPSDIEQQPIVFENRIVLVAEDQADAPG